MKREEMLSRRKIEEACHKAKLIERMKKENEERIMRVRDLQLNSSENERNQNGKRNSH